jgi:hypothetical protein
LHFKSRVPVLLSRGSEKEIESRSLVIGLFFEGYKNSTYKETKYFFKGDTFILNETKVTNKPYKIYAEYLTNAQILHPAYKNISNISQLEKDLETTNGYYSTQKSCNCEILTNKNGIKMKRTDIEFDQKVGILYEFMGPNQYYAILFEKNYEENYFQFMTRTNFLSDKDTYFKKELEEMKVFINTVEISYY